MTWTRMGAQRESYRGIVTGMASAGGALDAIVSLLHSTEDPDPELILDVGCGVLESLLFEHEEALWPEIERLARSDIRFRRALACVYFTEPPSLEYRALEIDASPPVRELPRMLREIGDKYQHAHSPETPILVRNHRIRELAQPWWDARSELIRAWATLTLRSTSTLGAS